MNNDFKILTQKIKTDPVGNKYFISLYYKTITGLWATTGEGIFCKTYKEAKQKQKEITRDLQDMGNYFDYLQPITQNTI